MGLVFGTAPDSWGVWHAHHPDQPHWSRFLDEVAAAGYLPTDANQLADELGRRQLGLLAGTLIGDLHLADLRPQLREQAHQICEIVTALGGHYLVLIPHLYRTDEASDLGPRQLDLPAWGELIATSNELGRIARDEYGLKLAFHPHADSVVEFSQQVDRLLDDTDSDAVHLCLDTGHLEYRDGDSVDLMRQRFERIPYLHLKSVDAAIKARVSETDLDFVTAVKLGVMVEPDAGVVDFHGLDQAMTKARWDGHAIVEQDLFPLSDLDKPLPIALRTRHYFQSLGWST